MEVRLFSKKSLPLTYEEDILHFGTLECHGGIGNVHEVFHRANYVAVALLPCNHARVKRMKTRQTLTRREKCVVGFACVQTTTSKNISTVSRLFERLSVEELRTRLGRLGKPTNGSRDDLTDRLRKSMGSLRGIYIDLICSRHSTGTIILERIKQFAKQLRYDFLELHALDENKLIGFYKRRGYRHTVPPCSHDSEELEFRIPDDGGDDDDEAEDDEDDEDDEEDEDDEDEDDAEDDVEADDDDDDELLVMTQCLKKKTTKRRR